MPASSAPAATYCVSVDVDLSSGTLCVARSNLQIHTGDSVLWTFNGIPPGWTPIVEFRALNSASDAFGPFTSLRQTSGAVVGGDATISGEFSYRVLVSRGFSSSWEVPVALITSAPANLTVGQEPIEPVEISVTPGQEEGTLSVSQPNVSFAGRQAIVWRFTGFDSEQFFPRIRFQRFDASGSGNEPVNLHMGPFLSLYLFRDTAQGEVGIAGAGNNNFLGTFYYELAVIGARSGVVGWLSTDPTIDNMGDPGGE